MVEASDVVVFSLKPQVGNVISDGFFGFNFTWSISMEND